MAETWDNAVLNVLKGHGKAMLLQEIYEKMESHPLVTSHHKEDWGGRPNYHHWIRSALARLKKHGAVLRVDRSLYISTC